MPFPPSVRLTQKLDGLWDFVFLGRIDLAAFDPFALCFSERAWVPSAFDALPSHAGQRGAAAYRTSLQIPVGQQALLEFGAVSMWSRIYVDGVLLEENACGYAPLSVSVPAADREVRELIVLVDNRFDFERVPMHEEYFDFYQYGGILRSVTLRMLPVNGPWLRSVQISATEKYREGEARVAVCLDGPMGDSTPLSFQFDGAELELLETSTSSAAFSLRVPNPRLWSPSSPALHRLRVVVYSGDQAVDDTVVKFGLRSIEAREGALWLNGERLILKGYNRHEWHPNFGPCTPPLQMATDLALLRELGCNFVRGSHYPQDQCFLDLCDELGFLVWEENLGWGQKAATFASTKFCRDHQKSLRAMVEASFNHPSIIIWGFLNEAASDDEGAREVLERTAQTLRALDPSRLISYASNRPGRDIYLHLVDVISYNLYPGWYGCEGTEDPIALIEPMLQSVLTMRDEQGWKGKPILLSETGAEALYGWHEAHHDFFSEEYQARYLQTVCRAVLSDSRWSGIALWHFSDIRTFGGGWSLLRPRTFNNKGTFDEYRRPKAAFASVREAFRQSEP